MRRWVVGRVPDNGHRRGAYLASKIGKTYSLATRANRPNGEVQETGAIFELERSAASVPAAESEV